jgi:membrane protease YdiL (CAAX protease family)
MKRILSFLALAMGFSWGTAGIGYMLGVRSTEHSGYVVVAALCMLGPALAALVQQRLLDREPWSGLGLTLKGTRWPVFVFTVLVGIAIVPLFLLAVHLLGSASGWEAFGQASITTERLHIAFLELGSAMGRADVVEAQLDKIAGIPAGLVLLAALLSSVVAAFTVNLPFMLGEELGWRGYLWQRSAHWPGMQRVLFTGVVWGLWHAPLIAMGHNYPGYPVIGIGMMVVFCTVLALLFDWTRSRSGSIWSACVLHGIINGSAGAAGLFAWGGHPLVGSVVGVAGMVAMAGLGALVLLVDAGYRNSFLRVSPTPAITI